MTNFNEALEYLGISEYSERIFKSNSSGELFHLGDYILLADAIKEGKIKEASGEPASVWFRDWFIQIVDWSQTWERPESIFQHMRRVLYETSRRHEK